MELFYNDVKNKILNYHLNVCENIILAKKEINIVCYISSVVFMFVYICPYI